MRADAANDLVRKNKNFSNHLVAEVNDPPETAVSQPEIKKLDDSSLHEAIEAASGKKRRRAERKIFVGLDKRSPSNKASGGGKLDTSD